MSKISIVILEKLSNEQLGTLKQILPDKSLMEIKKNCSDGSPVFEARLFYNDHDELADKLKKIIVLTENEKIRHKIYELDDEEEFNKIASKEIFEISEVTLLNILDSFDRERERQSNL
jgi:hypothetical protein